MDPKAARQQKQRIAQERRQQQAERQREKREARRQDALSNSFLVALNRWMRHDPAQGPLREPCPDCGAPIDVTYADDRMRNVHAEPLCEGYSTLQKMLGPRSPTLTAWRSGDLEQIQASSAAP